MLSSYSVTQEKDFNILKPKLSVVLDRVTRLILSTPRRGEEVHANKRPARTSSYVMRPQKKRQSSVFLHKYARGFPLGNQS